MLIAKERDLKKEIKLNNNLQLHFDSENQSATLEVHTVSGDS